MALRDRPIARFSPGQRGTLADGRVSRNAHGADASPRVGVVNGTSAAGTLSVSCWRPDAVGETTFTIFSDADSPGWADAFADLLRDGSSVDVDIADTLEVALTGDADVLVLNLGLRNDEKLPPEQVRLLEQRRVIGMAPGVDWLCQQLDDLEVGGGMIAQGNLPTLPVDSDLLGEPSTRLPIMPFAKQQERTFDRTAQTPLVCHGGANIDEYRPSVDYILVAEHRPKCAVVMCQANFLYAGVCAHPDEWSMEYRGLMQRVALALAERPVVDLKPVVIERQIHPPGTAGFDLEPVGHHESAYSRIFHFRFDRPTVFTATLEHSGSKAMMLLFMGGKKRLHWTRVDTEDGKTLTIAANISAASNRAVRHRYWMLHVTNFDDENAASAKLTVRYDTTDSAAPILALPGDAGFEHLNRHAEQLFRGAREGDASARERLAGHDVEPGSLSLETACGVTALEYGFNDWATLKSHVAWTPVWLPQRGTRGVDLFFARASERYSESFSIEQLIEFTGNFNDDVIASLKDAVAHVRSRGHRSLAGEHLLLALLDNGIADHVLRSVGCKFDELPSAIDALLAALPVEAFEGEIQVSKSVCGAVYRANFVNALGRIGTNAGALLAGIAGERGDAAKVLDRHGVSERNLVHYVSHGIATDLVDHPKAAASVLAPDLERAVHHAFVSAQSSRHEYLTIEHLLRAVLDSDLVSDAVRSAGADIRALQGDVATYIGTATPVVAENGLGPQPTRPFNRVMQMAVGKARSRKRLRANTLDALWALGGERNVTVTDHLKRHGISRRDVAARIT